MSRSAITRHARSGFKHFAVAWILTCARSAVAANDLPDPPSILIHLPGIGGERSIDHHLVGGLIAGGAASASRIIDWTGADRGLNALGNSNRHQEQAKLVAQEIIATRRNNPRSRLIVTAHSGGTGIAIWALEDLPPDVKIDTLVLLASALSPTYDLSAALRHVNGQAISFYSENDELVLGLGTRTFGTIDRVNSNAAGYVGFTPPAHADAAQYAKLKQYAYDPAWMRLGNPGTHIGPTSLPFAAEVIAPLINPSINARRRMPATTRAAAADTSNR